MRNEANETEGNQSRAITSSHLQGTIKATTVFYVISYSVQA